MQLLDTMLCMPPWRGCNKSVRCKIIYSFTGSFEVVRHLLKLLRTPDAYIARSSWRGCSGKDESGGVAWRVAAGSTAEMVDAPELTLTACKLQSMPSCGLLPPHLQHGRVGQGEGRVGDQGHRVRRVLEESQQAQKGDPDLDITKEMREVKESLEDAMNVRLATVCLLWCWPRCSCKLLSLVRRHWR